MTRCFVCKSTRRQLLMLSCSHDVCIKCAADNYFLNTLSARPIKKQREQKKNKKESYFCEICLQVTKIDDVTVGQLKQWYMTNVNGKGLRMMESANKSKINSKSKDKGKQMIVGRLGQQKVVTKSKPYNVVQKLPYSNHLLSNEQKQQPYQHSKKQHTLQRQQSNSYKQNKKNYNNSNYLQQRHYLQNNQYLQRNYHLNNNRTKQQPYQESKKQMPEQYQAKQLLRYKSSSNNHDKQIQKQRRKQQLKESQEVCGYNNNINNLDNNMMNEDNYYQRFSYNPYQRNHIQHNNRISNNINIPSSTSYTNNNKHNPSSSISKQKQQRAFGSIIINKKQQYQNEQRRRIDSYKSQQKYFPQYRNQNNNYERRLQTQTDTHPISRKQHSISRKQHSISRKQLSIQQGKIGQRSQHKLTNNHNNINNINKKAQQIYTTPRNQLKQKKKKQVYLDLIGYEHSLQYENTNNIINQSQSNIIYGGNNNTIQHNEGYQQQRRQIINKFSSPQSTYHNPLLYQQYPTISPKHNNNYPQQHKVYCNIHQDQQIIYYCLQCKLLICSQCALYGQHKDHNIHTLKKASLKLKQTLYILISQMNSYLLIQQQNQQLILQQIKQLKVQSNKQKQKVKFTFQNFIKNIQNKYSQILQQLQQSEAKALSGFNLQLERTKQKCSQYFDLKSSMKNLFQTFSQNPMYNQLVSVSTNNNYESMNIKKNLMTGGSTSASNNNNISNFNNNRVYRQFDDFFEQTASMTSQQRNFFNTNIQQLQSKISQYQDYMKRLKPQYQKVIYPTLYLNTNNNNNDSNNKKSQEKNKQFFRSKNKQQQQLHESLKLSQTSLLIQPQSPNNNRLSTRYQQFICQKDFIDENNLRSLNLVIQKQLMSEQFSQQQQRQSVRLGYVNTIVDSMKQIQQIIKQFRIQFNIYHIKTGRK